jgi:DNA-binding NarL/FixJ family response regulator
MNQQEETQKKRHQARLLLVESHVVVRQGLTHLINHEPDLVICGGVSETPAALEALADLKPDMVVTDITLKTGNGLEMIKTIAAQYTHLPVLVLTQHDEGLYAEIALRSGAMGYIMKDESIEKVLAAIRRVLSGKIYVSESVSLQMIRQQIRGPRKFHNSPEELLSDRELQVFQLIGQWRRTGQIARELHLSVKTVQYYREKIKEKLHLPQASDLTRFATESAIGNQSVPDSFSYRRPPPPVSIVHTVAMSS